MGPGTAFVLSDLPLHCSASAPLISRTERFMGSWTASAHLTPLNTLWNWLVDSPVGPAVVQIRIQTICSFSCSLFCFVFHMFSFSFCCIVNIICQEKKDVLTMQHILVRTYLFYLTTKIWLKTMIFFFHMCAFTGIFFSTLCCDVVSQAKWFKCCLFLVFAFLCF